VWPFRDPPQVCYPGAYFIGRRDQETEMKDDVTPRRRARRQRTNDPDGNRRNIVEIATQEFAENGFSGARVDEIAARTKTSKRMIYYYFGGKEGLYIAVLEQAYRNIRSVEGTLDLAHQPPEEALRALVGFTFDYQNTHPEFIRLVMNENILHGAYLAQSKDIQRLNLGAVNAVADLLARGQRDGTFRSDLDPVDLHMSISALCFFNVSNRATFSTIFKRDMSSRKALAQRRAQVIDVILRYVQR
jgi:AcrR family transcriptional regulator